MSLVRTEIDERVAVVTLDDPKRRNAISLRMAEELEAAFGSLEASPDVGAVVITGTPPAFSAGADLGDLERAKAAFDRATSADHLAVPGTISRILHAAQSSICAGARIPRSWLSSRFSIIA